MPNTPTSKHHTQINEAITEKDECWLALFSLGPCPRYLRHLETRVKELRQSTKKLYNLTEGTVSRLQASSF